MADSLVPGLPVGETSGINTFNEKSLHAALKRWYAQPDDRLEAAVDGYIIDLVRGEQLIEIQTGSVNKLKRKLAALARSHPVRLVYPIALEKWIVRLPVEGEAGSLKITRRKSPKRGQLELLFQQLVYIPALLAVENFTLEVLLIREEEVRRFDASRARAWRRKGWVTHERRLLGVVERRLFSAPSDLAALLPAGLGAQFTAGELARSAGAPDWLARKMIYCLRALGELDVAGKRGRAMLYARRDAASLTEQAGEPDGGFEKPPAFPKPPA
jgi:hypothetical protein